MLCATIKSLLGGCTHPSHKLSFPMTAPGETTPHVVCLQCAKIYPYDWEEMRLIRSTDETFTRRIKRPRPHPPASNPARKVGF